MTDEDMEEIAHSMGIAPEELNAKYQQRTHPLGPVNFCIFLNTRTLKCEIYPHRPVICSDYFCPEWEPEKGEK
jgi:Fe-S-cluster containining protein